MLEYRGYTGVFEFDATIMSFVGHVVDLRDDIYFEGSSVTDLRDSLVRAVDQYLRVCDQRGEQPDRPYSGRFNVRVEATTHRRISAAAAASGVSMNEWLTEVIESRLETNDAAIVLGRDG